MRKKKEKIIEELGDLKEVILAIAEFKNLAISTLKELNTVDDEIIKIRIEVLCFLSFIDSFSKEEGISNDEIEEARLKKLREKGGFEKRIILIIK